MSVRILMKYIYIKMEWLVYVTCPGESSHVVCEVSKRVTDDILF